MSPRDPKAASAIILLRAAERSPFEVLLVRHAGPGNMSEGFYGFPMDTVTAEDCANPMVQRCCGITAEEARTMLGAHHSPVQALGFWVAASRVLFTKLGILLAVDPTGHRVKENHPTYERCLAMRESLLQNKITFQTLFENESLRADFAGLRYFSHWQWSEPGLPRLDARFFLLFPAAGDQPVTLPLEPEDSFWVAPDRALALCYKSQWSLPFPIFASLRSLANFDSIQAVSMEYRLA
jgi:hypothetical protein